MPASVPFAPHLQHEREPSLGVPAPRVLAPGAGPPRFRARLITYGAPWRLNSGRNSVRGTRWLSDRLHAAAQRSTSSQVANPASTIALRAAHDGVRAPGQFLDLVPTPVVDDLQPRARQQFAEPEPNRQVVAPSRLKAPVALGQIVEVGVGRANARPLPLHIDEVHVAARPQEGRQMLDDLLLTPAAVGEDVAHDHHVEHAWRQARRGGVPNQGTDVVEAQLGGQGLGGADGLGVVVDGPHLTARSDEPGRQDRNCARSASHVGDDRALDDPHRRPLRRLALVGAFGHPPIAGDLSVAQRQRVVVPGDGRGPGSSCHLASRRIPYGSTPGGGESASGEARQAGRRRERQRWPPGPSPRSPGRPRAFGRRVLP